MTVENTLNAYIIAWRNVRCYRVPSGNKYFSVRMQLSVRIDGSLPQLAWLAEIDRTALAVRATVGRSVEVSSHFFVAGVWDGDFADGRFDATDCFFGTGLVAREDSAILVSSAALTDAVYYEEMGTRVIAANSLPLLLAATGDRLDPQFPTYDSVLESIQAGLDGIHDAIPTLHGNVCRLFVRNLRVTATTIKRFDKNLPPRFPDFSSYLHYLSTKYGEICRNIRDARRRRSLDVISTQSRGYDTSAVNSIALRHGIDAVFTVSEAKRVGYFFGHSSQSNKSDDGGEIGAVLGLPVVRLERMPFSGSFEEEYLLYAASNHAEAVNLVGLKRYLRGPSVMLTGVRGDVVWATDQYYRVRQSLLKPPAAGRSTDERLAEIIPEMLADDLRGPDTWLFGMSEIGLDWGLIQLAPVYIGARNQPDIFRITMSDEMRPWRIGGEYDRPIARRIAEEVGGIPRTLFAREKMATATEFPLPPVPMDRQLRREYFSFLEENRLASRVWRLSYRLIHRINAHIFYHTPRHYRYLYYLRRVLAKMTGRDITIPLLFRSLDARLYCVCVNKRARLYEKILSSGAEQKHGTTAVAEGFELTSGPARVASPSGSDFA